MSRISYGDIQDLVSEGKTAAEIAVLLSADTRTNRDVATGDLTTYLQETGLLYVTRMGGAPGGFLRVLYDSPSTPDALKNGLDRLVSHLLVSTSPIRTTRPDIGKVLNALVAALAKPGVIENLPVPHADIVARLNSMTGGRRFQNVKTADVQTVIDAQTKLDNSDTMQVEWQDAYNTHVGPVEHSGDRAAFVAALQAAATAMGGR